MSLNHLSDTTKPTLYLNPNVNNLTCVSLNSSGSTISGNETINGNLTVTGNTNCNHLLLFGGSLPGGYGFTTLNSTTAYYVGGDSGAFSHKFFGNANTSPLFTINATGAVSTTNNVVDNGSGQASLVSLLLSTPGGVPSPLNNYEVTTFTTTFTGNGTGPDTIGPFTLGITAIGALVSIDSSNSNIIGNPGTGGSLFTSNSALPSRFQPGSNKSFISHGRAGGSDSSVIEVTIMTNGLITIGFVIPAATNGQFGWFANHTGTYMLTSV